jgi:hypothetical protein
VYSGANVPHLFISKRLPEGSSKAKDEMAVYNWRYSIGEAAVLLQSFRT